MFNQILPQRIDNTSRSEGRALALRPTRGIEGSHEPELYLQRTLCSEFCRRDSPGHVYPRWRTGGSLALRDLGARATDDLLAVHTGVDSISHHDHFHVWAPLTGAPQ